MPTLPASRYVVFLSIAAAGCAIDLATKSWIFGRLGMPGYNPPIWLIDEIFGLETSLNEGALFGIGQGKVGLFAALSVVAALGIVYWLFVHGAARDWLLTVSLGSIMAGVCGNFYDRLGLHGLRWPAGYPRHEEGEPVYAVRDWLHFKVDAWNFDWPVFNIADSMLVCGALLLVLHSFLAPPEKAAAAAKAEAADVA
jgi:signal peptidase II